MLRPRELLIGDHNWQLHAQNVPHGQSRGLIPRDFSLHPRGCLPNVKAVDFPAIPRAEWHDRAQDQIARQGRLSDVMLAAVVPCLDQNGRGYCWMHSGTGCVQAARAVMGEPTIGLSAYSAACKIKGFRDEGGWGAQGVDFLVEHGVCDEKHWPQRGTDRSLDNTANWDNAKLYRVTAQVADMQSPQYDRNLAFEQYVTLGLLGNPFVTDWNWWSHSTMGCDAVEGASQFGVTRDPDSGKILELAEFDVIWGMNDPVTGGWGLRGRNSWGDSYGDRGFFTLTGSKTIPDSGVGILTVLPSSSA